MKTNISRFTMFLVSDKGFELLWKLDRDIAKVSATLSGLKIAREGLRNQLEKIKMELESEKENCMTPTYARLRARLDRGKQIYGRTRYIRIRLLSNKRRLLEMKDEMWNYWLQRPDLVPASLVLY